MKTSPETDYDLTLLEWGHSESWEPETFDDLRTIFTAPEYAEANEFLVIYWNDELADVYDNGCGGITRLDYFTMPKALRGPKQESARYALMQQLVDAIVEDGFDSVQSPDPEEIDDPEEDEEIE